MPNSVHAVNRRRSPPRRPGGSLGRRGPALRVAAALIGALLAAPEALRPEPKGPSKPASSAGIAVATLAYADNLVEKQAANEQGWRKLQEGERLRTGDRVRVGPDAIARFEFAWMFLTAGPDTTLHIPAERILSAVLDAGRAELRAPGQQIVKVRTGDAEIRGEGRVVVRREKTLVAVMAMDGTVRVEAAGKTEVLQAGEGSVVEDGQAPEDVIGLPPGPEGLWPGPDPVYVKKGQSVRLNWSPKGAGHHLQILSIDSSDPLLARDVGPAPYPITIPWLGTYRWRVATLDEKGLEGRSSALGYICVVDK